MVSPFVRVLRARPRRAAATLLVPLLALLLPVAGLPHAVHAAAAESDDAFYTPPDPLPAGQPGDVIRSRAVTLSTSSPAHAWQILYRSTTVSGAATAISGTVLVPDAAFSGVRPVVAYAPGTQGWGDQCAPSKEMAANNFDEQFAVDNLLAKGWAVVVTDYPGLGTPGDGTYNVGIAEGYGVLDALRAATRLSAAGLSATAPMGVEGYSQGGGAGDWAAQLAPTYAPELRMAGVAAGGTPANLQAVAENINGTLWFAFLAGTALGFNAAYPSLDMESLLTADGKAAMDKLNGQCQVEALVTFAGKRIEDYTVGRVNPIDTPSWKAVLDANNLGGSAPKVPVLQYHGLIDEIIPWQVESELHSQYCAAGVTTRLKGYLGEHVLTHLLAQADVVAWLADRFAGVAATRNC